MRRGRVEYEWVDSKVLRGNPLGDPHLRRVPVYLPPSYDASSTQRFPVVYALTGFMGRGRMLLNDNPWSPPIDDRMDRLIDQGCEEIILVMPDCFTRFGGSQYLNSTATGRYEDHLVQELVPWIDARYRTLAAREHRGVVGKSSGGYGALVLGMRHDDLFGAVACHSGDICFDYCYRPDLPRFCAAVQRGGGLEQWFASFESALHKQQDDFHVLNIVAMAAAYSPNSDVAPFGFELPIDIDSGRWKQPVWDRWLEHDPLLIAERHADALRSLQLLFLDCGTRDEWCLHLGARLLAERLKQLRVPHEHQEFDDGHMNISYRYDVSLPRLAHALSPKASRVA